LQQLTKHKKIQQKGLSDFDQEAFFCYGKCKMGDGMNKIIVLALNNKSVIVKRLFQSVTFRFSGKQSYKDRYQRVH